jgi:DNA-binding GntR family transcriptional regulator
MRSVVSPVTVPGGRLLRETVYDQLRADVISCRLAPGTELREAELAARFDMSKSPVRHASDAQLQTLDVFRRFDPAAWEGGFIAFNRAFHRRIAELGVNVRMRDQLNDLIDQMERAVQVSVANIRTGDPQVLVDEHAQIIDALQQRSLRKAQRLAEQHVVAAGKRFSDSISKSLIAG